MCRVGADGSLKKALESMFGHNFTYVQCTLGNGVVDQPGAQQLHQAYAGFGSGPNRVPRLFTVKAPHCAYLQMQPQFEEVLVPRLRMLA